MILNQATVILLLIIAALCLDVKKDKVTRVLEMHSHEENLGQDNFLLN